MDTDPEIATGHGATLLEAYADAVKQIDRKLQQCQRELATCPLRQLAKWAEDDPERRYISITHGHGKWWLRCFDEPDDVYDDADTGLRAMDKGSTILEAAADAVKQLKESGEL